MPRNTGGLRQGGPGRPKGARNKVDKETCAIFLKLGGADGKVYAERLHELATGAHDDPNVRIKALALIAPYVWGKPTERHEHTGPGGGPITVNHHYAGA